MMFLSLDFLVYWIEHGTIGSDNGLSPARRRAIIWPNVDLQSIGP